MKTNEMSEWNRRFIYCFAIFSASFCISSGAIAADPPKRDLNIYPCHSYTEPCGKLPPPAVKKVEWTGEVGDPDSGQGLAFATPLGNCLACHEMKGGTQGGTIGPSLVDYAKRALPLSYTYQRIFDTREFNPDAHMPLFGTNNILTDQQIRDIMAFLYKR
jgi:sulfur-oxidizing protein SoxX